MVFPAEATGDIADSVNLGEKLIAGSHWMVISHSCDINSPSPIETSIEIILMTPIDKQDNANIHGRHPRFYHLKTTGNKWYEARIDRRGCVDRSFCAKYAPCTNINISKKDILTIVQWVAYRYVRSAFPDEFNVRVSRKNKAKESLKKLLQQGESELLYGLFINISPNNDLPPNEDYNIQLLGLVEDAITQDDLKVATGLVHSFAAILDSCDGINVSHECLKKSDITFAEWEQYQRFTDYDYLSSNE